MSRKLYPKQYLALAGEMSMLQETLKRLEGLDANQPVLVCNEEQRFVAAEQMRRMGLDDVSIILEPEGRNTAPAIALAALHAVQADKDMEQQHVHVPGQIKITGSDPSNVLFLRKMLRNGLRVCFLMPKRGV